MVEVSWKDRLGRIRSATALLEDISRSGACLQFEVAVPAGTVVDITCAADHLEGCVRYCTYREIGYFVGVQFADDTKWDRQHFEPQHLLDLQDLISRGKKQD